MPKIENYAVTNFSGGVVRNKSLFEMKKNELLDSRNIFVDDAGRITTRRGSQQVGNTLAGTIDNSFVFERFDAGSTPGIVFLVNNRAATGVISLLRSTRLTANVATSDTTITVASTANFAASGTIEIDGDLIAYTGTTGTTFTGCSGITFVHSAGIAVNQWSTLTQSGTAVDAQMGVYYAVLNNILIFGGRLGNLKQFDAGTVTDVSSEPSILFLTNYRDRIYGAGSNDSGTNGDPRRVSFSARGDGTSWTTTTDFFDVEDQRGEPISGLKILNDKLWIFKPNTLFSYDEIELKQRQFYTGAWNHRSVQEINSLMYTFCPEGIFATNGFESQNIGLPVKQYWKNFQPTFDAATQRVVLNTFSGKFGDHYLIYIGDVTDPVSTNDVVLDYDTIRKAWTVHSGWTDITHFGSFDKFRFGDRAQQYMPALFMGDVNAKYYRLFENRYMDNQSINTRQGTDIFQDLVSDTGSVVSAMFETPLYDFTHPHLYKSFKFFRGFTEQGQWMIDYRVENEDGITAYSPLGAIRKSNQVLPFPKEAAGWRVGFRGASVNTASTSIFNGFILEDTEVIKRP